MSDLVKRLRGPVKHPQQSVTFRIEAADRIERLETALRKIIANDYQDDNRTIASKALGESK